MEKFPIVFCEHCGEIETNTPQYEHEGVQWCQWCACANGLIDDDQLVEEGL